LPTVSAKSPGHNKKRRELKMCSLLYRFLLAG
jgi:hypothetical protein